MGPKWTIHKKFFLPSSHQKTASAYAQPTQKCFKLVFRANIDENESKFFSNFALGALRFGFRPKKNSKLSHACVPLTGANNIHKPTEKA
jgi:hypothetical protein